MFTCAVLGKYLALHHSNMLNYRNLLSQMLSVVSNVKLQMLSGVSRVLSSCLQNAQLQKSPLANVGRRLKCQVSNVVQFQTSLKCRRRQPNMLNYRHLLAQMVSSSNAVVLLQFLLQFLPLFSPQVFPQPSPQLLLPLLPPQPLPQLLPRLLPQFLRPFLPQCLPWFLPQLLPQFLPQFLPRFSLQLLPPWPFDTSPSHSTTGPPLI